jgi:hypothetical protein
MPPDDRQQAEQLIRQTEQLPTAIGTLLDALQREYIGVRMTIALRLGLVKC